MKYDYFKVIQQQYAEGWEDASHYPCNSQGVPEEYCKPTKNRHGRMFRKSLLATDLAEYRRHPYPTRVIFRRVLKPIPVRVGELLSELKANSRTYHNLDKDTVESFQKLYKYLKKRSEKLVKEFYVMEVKRVLTYTHLIEYSRKFKALELLAQGIK